MFYVYNDKYPEWKSAMYRFSMVHTLYVRHKYLDNRRVQTAGMKLNTSCFLASLIVIRLRGGGGGVRQMRFILVRCWL